MMAEEKPQRAVVYTRLPASLKRRMIAEAKRRGVSLNALCQAFMAADAGA